MDLSFSKAEPLLRSFQRLARRQEQDLVHTDVLRLANGDGNSPCTCLSKHRACIRLRSRAAIPAHFDTIVQRSKGILAVITFIAFLVM
jgi:hypothetical protein